MKKNVDVSIVIVNYKTSYLVNDCVKSIIEKSEGFSYEIIVVDNSMDPAELLALDKVATLYSGIPIHIIDALGNVGFGNANNIGAEKAKGEYLFFLNSDTILINNAIYESYFFLKTNKQIGIVGSSLFNKELKHSHSFIRSNRTIKNPILQFFPYELLKTCLGLNKHYNSTNKPLDIKGYVSGAALIISKSLFQLVGGFSKDIFMYGEDILLCGHVKKRGYSIFNIPTSKIIHFEGGSDEKVFSSTKIKNYVNGTYFCRLELYGNKKAMQYLKQQWIVFKLKWLLLTILHKKNAALNKHNLSKQYKCKYLSLAKM